MPSFATISLFRRSNTNLPHANHRLHVHQCFLPRYLLFGLHGLHVFCWSRQKAQTIALSSSRAFQSKPIYRSLVFRWNKNNKQCSSHEWVDHSYAFVSRRGEKWRDREENRTNSERKIWLHASPNHQTACRFVNVLGFLLLCCCLVLLLFSSLQTIRDTAEANQSVRVPEIVETVWKGKTVWTTFFLL